MLKPLLCLLAGAAFTHAGVVIEEETQTGEHTFGTTIIKIQDDKMRIQLAASAGKEGDFIVDLKAKSTTEIIGEGKFAMLLPLKPNVEASTLTATNQHDKVGEWNALKFLGAGEAKNIAIWMSLDVTDAKIAREAFSPFLNAGAPTGNFGLNWSAASGFPVRAEATFPGGKRTIKLKSITIQPLADTEFQLPPGCKIMNTPVQPAVK